jgi:pimeloyl-ACP methyl ester carboxylesterase
VNGTELHYVSAGSKGSPVLIVHGFPESWWAFRRLIPLLSKDHRVFAVDLRGFGDSAPAADGDTSATAAQDLAALITELPVRPRPRSPRHPRDAARRAGARTYRRLRVPVADRLAGFRDLRRHREFVRVYAGPSGFSGAAGLYRSLLTEGDEIRSLAAEKLDMPVLAIGGGSGEFTWSHSVRSRNNVEGVVIDGVGHYVAMEAPNRLADELVSFYAEIEKS